MKHNEYIVPIGEEAKEFDEMFIGVIRRQPELIRCRECKHRIAILMNGQPVVMLCGNERNDEAFSVDIDDYCSRAERKEHETD